MDITDSHLSAIHSKQRQIHIPNDTVQSVDIVEAIQQSDRWKTMSLQHFFIHDLLLFTTNLQNTDTKFYLVSDGGLHEGDGSFGVAMGSGQNA